MEILLYIADFIINFFGFIIKRYCNVYDDFKRKAFEHKLIYYAVYEKDSQKYTLVHNYDKPLYVFYFYVMNYILKLNYAGVSYLDLDLILRDENVIVVTSYVLNNKEYHSIYDLETYSKPRMNYHSKVVYAFAESNANKEDLTHEYELFKNTLFELNIRAQHIHNVLMRYKEVTPEKINMIRLMTDETFEEKVLT